MDLTDPAERNTWTRELGRCLTGRPVLCGVGVLAGYTDTVRMLHELGARVPMVLATHRGAGPVPDEDEAHVVALSDRPAVSYELATEELRAQDRAIRNLPDDVVAAVEAYDPERVGVWMVGSAFVTNDEPILGRPVFGGRPARWLALEDKLFAERLWDEVGIPHAPSRIVPVDLAALRDAARETDRGAGTVWSGDARDGFNGGGDFVRWVVDDAEQRAALDFFAPRCDRVRVLPFLDGVPCSIHGIALPDGTAVFRPVEIAMLRSPSTRRFVYGGLSSFWDPAPADRAAMRVTARRVGEHLRRTQGYRGAFGIDGVLTEDGFRPTELNPRMSAGLGNGAASVDRAAFAMLQATLVSGGDPRVTVDELEAVVPLMDQHRHGKAVAMVRGMVIAEPIEAPLDWDGTRLSFADRPTGNTLVLGDTPTGGFAKVEPCELLVPGSRLAPVNQALMRLLDEEYDAGFGDLEAAPDVRATP